MSVQKKMFLLVAIYLAIHAGPYLMIIGTVILAALLTVGFAILLWKLGWSAKKFITIAAATIVALKIFKPRKVKENHEDQPRRRHIDTNE